MNAKKHQNSSVDGDYNARTLQYRVKLGLSVVTEVRVEHVHIIRQLDLGSTLRVAQCDCNCHYSLILTVCAIQW